MATLAPPRSRTRTDRSHSLGQPMAPSTWKTTPRGVCSRCRRRVTLSLIAGTGGSQSTGDGGPAISAQIGRPWGLALDEATSSLYFSDYQNSVVRKVDLSTGLISTYAGGGVAPSPGYGDSGFRTAAVLANPTDVSLGPDGALYISDSGHNRIRRVAPNGVIDAWLSAGDCSRFGGPGRLLHLRRRVRCHLGQIGSSLRRGSNLRNLPRRDDVRHPPKTGYRSPLARDGSRRIWGERRRRRACDTGRLYRHTEGCLRRRRQPLRLRVRRPQNPPNRRSRHPHQDDCGRWHSQLRWRLRRRCDVEVQQPLGNDHAPGRSPADRGLLQPRRPRHLGIGTSTPSTVALSISAGNNQSVRVDEVAAPLSVKLVDGAAAPQGNRSGTRAMVGHRSRRRTLCVHQHDPRLQESVRQRFALGWRWVRTTSKRRSSTCTVKTSQEVRLSLR